MKRLLFAFVFILIMGSGMVGVANAQSIAHIKGWVDWSTFLVTVHESLPSYIDKGSYSQANAGYSDSMTPPDEEWGPRTPTLWGTTDAEKTVGNVTGHTWTTETGINTDAYASADGIANTYGRASSWVYRIGYFTVSEDSLLNASVTFNLEKYFKYDTSFETAGGYNFLGIGLGRINPNTGITEPITSRRSEYWYNSNNGDLNGLTSSTETLAFSYNLEGGYTYAVDVAIDSDANCGTRAVPGTNGLEATIIALVQSGAIAERLQASLLAKVKNAGKSADKGNICGALGKLKALKNQVYAQKGKKISDGAADKIIADTDIVIAYLLNQLPPGDSC